MSGRRVAAAVAVAAVLLLASACGGTGGAGGGAGPTTTAAGQADLVGVPEGRGVVVTAEDGQRIVRSAWGETRVPADPQRVVSVIGDLDADAMVALGVAPVAAGTQSGDADGGFAPHLADGLAGVQPLAWSAGTPVEEIAALAPDLVFAPDEDTARQLSEIAPTVPNGSWLGAEWREDLRYIAAVLGRTDEAERALAEYDDRVAALTPRVAPALAGRTVVSPQVRYDGAGLAVDPGDAFSSTVLRELGATLHPLVEQATGDPVELSFEELARLDADILFWQVRQRDDGTPDTAALDAVRANPLWERLPAVAAGAVHEVANRPWYFPGLTAAHRILDDVEQALT